ncbi:GNAT family N-acetyltransferase [Acinetobacter johnsonii]|uniref:GNAT family N-acetyltransferase n=1 Tax=Acinetobacter johnsonii TaxID=40214 RepID=UPI001F395655|nr:GNAT family N-acetyltransferase [Acinetobacter johnsonii]UJA01466.1 GNAT family N-acetyltransferase [Acinetobacter johnsonii]
MSTEIDISEVELKNLESVQKHLYQEFECEREELNKFLIEDAFDYHGYGLTKTTLVFHNSELIGFFSLSADKIVLTNSEKAELALNGEFPITFFPAVKVTKLAVDKKCARKGYGSLILELIEGVVYSNELAVRFLTLDAVNEQNVITFYEKNGFVESLHEASERRQKKRRETILMHKDLFAD